MHTEVLPVDNCSDRNVVEEVHDHVVHLKVVVLDDLVSEVEHVRHVSRFMITTEKEDVLWISELQSEEVDYHFWPVFSSIDVVSHEQNLGVLVPWLTQFPEHSYQVVELTVDVADDDYFAF